MPERSTISQVVQIGIEATPGTAVAANKKLNSMSIDPSVQANIDTFRPAGSKYATVASLNQEWSQSDMSGKPTYSEIIYPLSGVMTTATVAQILDGATPTTGYRWTFAPLTSSEDTPKTMTMERGTAARAERLSYGLFTSMGMNVGRANVEMNGSMMGRALETGITLTATPTELELIPILPGQFDLFMDTTAAGIGTTKLARVLSANWSLGDRFNPLWVLDSAQNSWVAHVEKEPTATIEVMMEADAAGMAMFTPLRDSSTRFFRLRALGPTIFTGGIVVKYSFTLDVAAKISAIGNFRDEEGVYAISFTLRIVHDPVWGKALTCEVINKQSGL